MMDAFTRFFTERVFGPGRAAMLTAHLPASAAAADSAANSAPKPPQEARQNRHRRTALITELETPVDPGRPRRPGPPPARPRPLHRAVRPAHHHRNRASHPGNRPPRARRPHLAGRTAALGDILTGAPAALTERLLAAFDIKAVYNRDKHQVTIHATITDATPQAVLDLLSDPRADHNKQPASHRAQPPKIMLPI